MAIAHTDTAFTQGRALGCGGTYRLNFGEGLDFHGGYLEVTCSPGCAERAAASNLWVLWGSSARRGSAARRRLARLQAGQEQGDDAVGVLLDPLAIGGLGAGEHADLGGVDEGE